MNAKEVLIALTRQGGPFCRRRWIAVPNVSWGWDLRYEADLITISKVGLCVETEIKISRSDLIVDRQKRKWRDGLDQRIGKFYYAVPEDLRDDAINYIPEYCGLITVKPGSPTTASLPRAEVIRRAAVIKTALKPTTVEINKLLHLGIMRYWDLVLQEGAA